MLDVLSEIYRNRGKAAPTRSGADRSVHTVGYLIEAPDPVTYLCTVSVFDSEPISGVPATSMDYTDITAVHVLLDPFTGRPVHVLGPAGELPFGEVPFARDTRHVVTGRLIPPTSTGTYREDEGAWDRYSITTFGGVTDMWQQAAPAAANLIPDPVPDTASTWSVERAVYTFFDDSYGPVGFAQHAFYFNSDSTSHTCKAWPVGAGTSAIAVTAGASYTVCAMGLSDYNATYHPDAALMSAGIDWYDTAGDFLSTSEGAALTSVRDDGSVWDSNDWVGSPTATVTAPASAAYGRPFYKVEDGTEGYYYATGYVAQFVMVAT